MNRASVFVVLGRGRLAGLTASPWTLLMVDTSIPPETTCRDVDGLARFRFEDADEEVDDLAWGEELTGVLA